MSVQGNGSLLGSLLALGLAQGEGSPVHAGIYFPPAGQCLAEQDQRTPQEVGLAPQVIGDLQAVITSGRWAIWRHGYLVHVEGSFNGNTEIKSARKTFHAATVGAALYQQRIPSIDQKISVWNTGLPGCDADATWWHVMTQTTTFDDSGTCPGQLWAYSDANPYQLCLALARVWGFPHFNSNYQQVIGGAFLDAIGAQGWSVSASSDGIRLYMDLEDLGRFGLLLVTGGVWDGVRRIEESFIDSLGTKQTHGITPNFDNANDGHTGLLNQDFPESPYGFMTWVNTDGDLWPGAPTTWASGLGAGGHYVAWDRPSGLVFAGLSAAVTPVPGDTRPGWPIPIRSVVEALHDSIAGANPLIDVAGVVPGGSPGQPLTLALEPGGDLSLSWDFSCRASDTDYAVYEGTLGDFTSHQPLSCSTAGSRSVTLTPSAGDRYYLIVPRTGWVEGSYGTASDGTPRSQGQTACMPSSFGSCD